MQLESVERNFPSWSDIYLFLQVSVRLPLPPRTNVKLLITFTETEILEFGMLPPRDGSKKETSLANVVSGLL